ncbi:Portal protein [Entamoeba marina]
MYAHAIENGVVMSNVVGDRIYNGLALAISSEEEKEKREKIINFHEHFERYIDDPENTAVGNYACDELVRILKYHQKCIGIRSSIIDINLNHELRRSPNDLFTSKDRPFESWKLLRRGTLALHQMESGEYIFCRVSRDYRLTNEIYEIPVEIDTTGKIISVSWTKLIIVPADVADSSSFGGSLNGLCKDYAAVKVSQILSDVNEIFMQKLREEFNVDIGFLTKVDSLRRKHVTAIKEVHTKMVALNDIQLTNCFEEVTEILRSKLSEMVSLVRRGVVPTYVLLQSRTKIEIIRVDYREWARKRFSAMLKTTEKLIKALSKEKDAILSGALIKEMGEWQNNLISEKALQLLVEMGFDSSLASVTNMPPNIEGLLYNKSVIEQIIQNQNQEHVVECITTLKKEITKKLSDYLSKLRGIALSVMKTKDVKEMSDEEALKIINNYVQVNSLDDNIISLQMITDEMNRIVIFLNAGNEQRIGGEEMKSMSDMFFDNLRIKLQQISDLLENNKDKNQLKKRQTVDHGLVLAPHVKLQRWLQKQQMQN